MSAKKEAYHMNVVDKGDLERITHSGNSRSRSGSKAPVKNGRGGNVSNTNTASTSSSRFQSSIASSLELLTPAEVIGQEHYDLELEDYGSDDTDDLESESDGDTVTMLDTGRTSSLFCIAEPPGEKTKNQQVMAVESVEDEEYLATRQLALFANEESDIEVDSEEERDIIREIKHEITAQVREEMGEELAAARHRRQRQSQRAEDRQHEDLNDMEPQLRQAFIKMRKLDKILAKKIKREKEVKRDRILLQKRLKEELKNIKSEGKKELKEVETNTMKFLALTLPPSHNEGVTLLEQETGEEEEEQPPVTPVFATQLPMEGEGDTAQQTSEAPARASATDKGSTSGTTSRSDGATSTQSGSTLGGSSVSGSQASEKRRKKKNKDFIKRNMELAANAADGIAMTDDEKQRVDDLLKDLDSIPEMPEDLASLPEENPFQITLMSGEGFLPSPDEMHRLGNIDSRLQELLPPEDFQAIASSARSTTSAQSSSSMLFTRTRGGKPAAYNVEDLGEQALKETKEHRDLQGRLREIEDQLNHLTSTVELEIESPSLSEDQLNDLLDMCARTISRTTAETDSIAQSTARTSVTDTSLAPSRASLLENPPKLPDSVLQQLLAEARQSISPCRQDPGEALDERPDSDDLVIKSVSEDTIRELLQNSRATSRAGSRQHQLSLHTSQAQISASEPVTIGEHRDESPGSRCSSRQTDERRPFLPEIDPHGSLITQGLNNQTLNNNSQSTRVRSGGNKNSAVTIRNQFSADSRDSSPPLNPQPPSGRQSMNSRASIRTLTPLGRDSFDN